MCGDLRRPVGCESTSTARKSAAWSDPARFGPAAGHLVSRFVEGRGYCFQAMIDNCAFYRDALTADEIRSIWRNGLECLRAQRARAVAAGRRDLCPGRVVRQGPWPPAGRTWPEKGKGSDPKFAWIIVGRLRTDFPDDFANFVLLDRGRSLSLPGCPGQRGLGANCRAPAGNGPGVQAFDRRSMAPG